MANAPSGDGNPTSHTISGGLDNSPWCDDPGSCRAVGWYPVSATWPPWQYIRAGVIEKSIQAGGNVDNYRSTALIVGVNGITGSEIARQLSIRNDWTVYGLSRSEHQLPPGVRHVRADLQDPQDVARALRDIRPTHVFLNVWSRQESEEENIRVNGAMLRNLFGPFRF